MYRTDRSEIVVPIKDRHGRVLGEIDIDSDQAAAFGDGDRQALELAAEILADHMERMESPRAPEIGARPTAGATGSTGDGERE